MRGIIRLLPSGEVASGCAASSRRDLQIVVVGNVAVGAGVHFAGGCELVQILQWEAGGVMAPGGSPIRGCVACGALGRGESGGNVIGNGAAHG